MHAYTEYGKALAITSAVCHEFLAAGPGEASGYFEQNEHVTSNLIAPWNHNIAPLVPGGQHVTHGGAEWL